MWFMGGNSQPFRVITISRRAGAAPPEDGTPPHVPSPGDAESWMLRRAGGIRLDRGAPPTGQAHPLLSPFQCTSL